MKVGSLATRPLRGFSAYLLLAVLAAWLAGFASTAFAQIKMEIVGPGSKQFPIAISALKNLRGDDDHAVSNEFDEVVFRDLQLSGFFKIISPESYIEDAQQSGYRLGEFNFADWSSLNAQFLIKGAVGQDSDGKLVVEVFLFDVTQQRQALGKRYRGTRANVAEMARRFVDAVMQATTGERGPFDSKLALVSTGGGHFKEIFIMSVDGRDIYRVTNNNTINLFPSFGRSASELLYTSYKTGTPALYLADLEQRREVQIRSQGGHMVDGALSPDGRMIAAAIERGGATNLYLLDRSGGLIKVLTQTNSINVGAAFSKDGRMLAFTSDRAGSPQIYVMDINGEGVRRVTYQGNYNSTPAFAPKGDRIAYQGRNGGKFDIYVVSLNGGDPIRLTEDDASNQQPCWSPDGRYLVYTAVRGGRSRLYLMQVEARRVLSALTEGNSNDSDPTWSWWLAE